MTRAFALALVLAAACAAETKERPLRSPSYDYPAPGPFTADGDTVGADKQNTSDKLRSGARVGSEGVAGPDYGTEEESDEEDEEER